MMLQRSQGYHSKALHRLGLSPLCLRLNLGRTQTFGVLKSGAGEFSCHIRELGGARGTWGRLAAVSEAAKNFTHLVLFYPVCKGRFDRKG